MMYLAWQYEDYSERELDNDEAALESFIKRTESIIMMIEAGHIVTVIRSIRDLRASAKEAIAKPLLECDQAIECVEQFGRLIDLTLEEYRDEQIEIDEIAAALKDALGDTISPHIDAIQEARTNITPDWREDEMAMLKWRQAGL